MDEKQALRKRLRKLRREHAASLPTTTSALLFRRPPRPVMDLVPQGASIGLYHAATGEAPAGGYARFLYEEGHPIALPWFAGRGSPMEFRAWTDPFADTDLEQGTFGLVQPVGDAHPVMPQVLFMPLVGFTEEGARLGQGGGYYDRWLAEHPGTIAIGLAWDCQLVESLPVEPHDMPLAAVVTPTRLYGPF